LSILLSFDQ